MKALPVLIQMKAFPTLLDTFGLSGIFFIASFMSLVGALFSFFFIPETRNKSIYELETMFAGQSKHDVENCVKN